MRGTLLNTATVAAGATAGLLTGRFVPPDYKSVALEGLGLVVVLIGVRMFLQSRNPIIGVASIAFGGIIGACIGIPHALAVFAEWCRQILGGTGHFNEALITTSVLFCVGPMTLLGCLQDGLENKIELLAVKSTLDGIGAFFFAATLGSGVLVTTVVVLVVQGSITLAARRMQRFAKDEELMAEATATGGALMLGIGLGLLSIKSMHIETYLPAVILAPLFVLVSRRVVARRAA
jgi:uncharacterized membrane protein YqgA involved in biofilm formation